VTGGRVDATVSMLDRVVHLVAVVVTEVSRSGCAKRRLAASCRPRFGSTTSRLMEAPPED
jgi:hypothetical protein